MTEAPAPRQKCRQTGCNRLATGDTGVCRDHRHASKCLCLSCTKRAGQARQITALTATVKSVLVPHAASYSGVPPYARVSLSRAPWEAEG